MTLRHIALIAFFGLLCAAFGMATAQNEEPTAAGEKVKLVLLSSINVDTEGYDVNDNPYLSYIEEMNNVDIEIISAASNYNQKVNTVMASGDLPDYAMVFRKSDLAIWARDGLLQPLDDLIDQYGPDLKRDMKPVSWELSTVDGQIFAIPMQRYDASPYMAFVLKDWIKNLGIDLDTIETVEDWHGMMTRMVNDDPDKNGMKDTQAILARGTSNMSLEMFMDAFDAADARYVGDEVLPRYLRTEYRDWLKYMQGLYAEGLIDPEYVVTNGQQYGEKQRSGEYGVWMRFWSLQGYINRGGAREDVMALKPPKKLKDGSQSKYLYGGPVRHYMVVTKDSKHPEKVVQVLNWAFTDAGGDFVHAGVEGLDYDRVNGKVQVRADRRGRNWAWRFITMGIQKVNMDDHLKGLLQQSWGELGIKHLEMSATYGRYDDIELLAPFFPELADYDLDAGSAQVLEFRNNAIMGRLDVDAEWDDYVAKWRRSGGDEWIRLHTDWYLNDYSKR